MNIYSIVLNQKGIVLRALDLTTVCAGDRGVMLRRLEAEVTSITSTITKKITKQEAGSEQLNQVRRSGMLDSRYVQYY